MTVNNTTAPAVLARLQTLFTAATDPAKTEVWGNRPNEEHQLAENVYIGDVRGERQYRTLPAIAPNSREERYIVTVEVEVYRQGTDGAGTEARAWEIGGQLETTIAEQGPKAFTVGHVDWGIATQFTMTCQGAEDGFLAKYTFGVSVTARI